MRENNIALPIRCLEPISELLNRNLDRIDALYHSGQTLLGISTGLDDLDHITSGLKRQELSIVAGRPSMGKSVFVYNLAANAASDSEELVVIFSMGTPSDNVSLNLLASFGTIHLNKLRNGTLKQDDWSGLISATNTLSSMPLFIDESSVLSVGGIREKLHALHDQKGPKIKMIVIDGIALLQDDNNNMTDRCFALKALAKEFNIPVVATSQLNRNLENRDCKRPILSDLDYDGVIGDYADLVSFIYRDEVYDDESDDKGIADIIIGKNRNGQTGSVRLTFHGQYARFESFSEYDLSD